MLKWRAVPRRKKARDMSRTLRLDQVFYGTSPSGYGILGTSLTDRSIAQSAINVCLAVGQNPGAGLVKPILLSRVLGDRIVMARLCNGSKDSSGRNSIFIHALVASAQEVRSANVTTFSLEDDGVFRHRMPDSPSMPIVVEARSRPEAPSSMQLELPAAIEASEPDIALMRRIVSGRENELSWSTFAFDDMPGYDIFCLSRLASSPEERNIYDTDLRLMRGITSNVNVSAPVSAPLGERPARPPQRTSTQTNVVQERRNGLLIPLLVSIVINVVLLVIFVSTRDKQAVMGTESDQKQQRSIVEAARQKFTGENRVPDEMLKNCGSPLGNLFRKDGSVSKDRPDQVDLFHKLLAYKKFVEEFILNPQKEK